MRCIYIRVSQRKYTEASVSQTWYSVREAMRKLGSRYHGDVVFIGGAAVNLHLEGAGRPDLMRQVPDIDLVISTGAFLRMREEFLLHPGLDGGRFAMKIGGVQADVDPESDSDLLIPCEEIRAAAVSYKGIACASAEHLLALKLDAALRRSAERAARDEQDIVRIMAVMPDLDIVELTRWLTQEMAAKLDAVSRSEVSLDRRSA